MVVILTECITVTAKMHLNSSLKFPLIGLTCQINKAVYAMTVSFLTSCSIVKSDIEQVYE